MCTLSWWCGVVEVGGGDWYCRCKLVVFQNSGGDLFPSNLGMCDLVGVHGIENMNLVVY